MAGSFTFGKQELRKRLLNATPYCWTGSNSLPPTETPRLLVAAGAFLV
ncbi:hypothetical protein KBK19_14475 [Microvirga sp. STR05]|uniref:Uncharacterized protein n=1 Tax=Hymenobacter duratus TaxID=2771356 RepID=A0ABR8JHB7_9BACT|nr:hypothetical protein [Hymenobacter duratus]MBD2716242.1 hypothetical protein [Hymenobacter duratus]MBR7951158.1 hypothetical protein [Microvirga sp. STR05]